ncbi:MAG: ParA family protein [Deltaproteobacteria bacterium]|nr:ParA family protein [Deltaproteobacteria bacterium]
MDAAPQPASSAIAVPVVPILRGNAQAQGAKPASGNAEPPRFLAIFNHKGGTGKTTTSVSIAAGLAAQGKRVLLVDTDSQGNVAVSLNVNTDKSLYHVLVMGLPVKAVCQTVRENLDLVASNETLAAAELYLAGKQNRDRVLRDRLMSAAQAYDYVLLDCSPSLSLMNQNSLVFADSVLVPVACDFLSLAGVRQVLKTVRNVNQLLHHPVRIWGVLPTFYDARANICRNAVETLQQHFGERCLPPIRQAIKVKEAPSEGKTIFEYAPGSAPADDYRTVVDRIVHGHQAEVFNTQAEAATAC